MQDNNIQRQTSKNDHYFGCIVMFRKFISSAVIFELQLPTVKFTVSHVFDLLTLGMTFFLFFPIPIYFFQFPFGHLFPFSLWTSISLFSSDFYFPFSLWTFIQSRSHFGFLPNFFSLKPYLLY